MMTITAMILETKNSPLNQEINSNLNTGFESTYSVQVTVLNEDL